VSSTAKSAAGAGQTHQREMKSTMTFSRSFTMSRHFALLCAALLVLAMIASGKASAQSAVKNVPNAMQGFSQNRDQPIQIEAASLDIRDKQNETAVSCHVQA